MTKHALSSLPQAPDACTEEHPHGVATDAGERGLVTTRNEPVGRSFWIVDVGW